MKEETNQWDDSLCWFCKKRSATEGAKHEVDLYRVLERKSTYIVVGMQYKQRYEKTKTWVPRCELCKIIHDRVSMVFLVLWLILGTYATIWYFSQPDKRSDSVLVSIFGVVIAIVMIYFMCAVAVGFLYMFTNIFWKSEDKAEGHPRVKALTNEGWEVGDKPPYKWSGTD